MPRGQRDGSPRPYSRLSRPEQLLLLSSISSVVLTRLEEKLQSASTERIYTFRTSRSEYDYFLSLQ
jgi:hypothetical protein